MAKGGVKAAIRSLERHRRAVSIPRITGPMRPKPPKAIKSSRDYAKASDFTNIGFGDTGLDGDK